MLAVGLPKRLATVNLLRNLLAGRLMEHGIPYKQTIDPGTLETNQSFPSHVSRSLDLALHQVL